MQNSPSDPNFYSDGAKRMIAEGMEVASKILAFMRENNSAMKDMDAADRKKFVLTFEPAKTFNQIHPIVFQYIATEGIFHAAAFRRYIMSVYGKPKDPEDERRMREDRKYLYFYKNKQYALYYKYLMMETNPNIKPRIIHSMYEDVVNELNNDTQRLLDLYEQAEEEAKIKEDRFNEEKRRELVELLKKRA